MKGREWGEHLKEALRLKKPQRRQRTKLETMWLNEAGNGLKTSLEMRGNRIIQGLLGHEKNVCFISSTLKITERF